MNHALTRLIAHTAAALFLAAGSVARVGAQESWTLMSADLSTEPAVLHSIDPSGVHLAADGDADRVVPFAQFVELSRAVAAPTALPATRPADKFWLHLTTGDRLGGEPAGLKGESLVWDNLNVGEVEIPLRQLKALTRPGGKAGDERRKEDVVTLANGDSVRGAVGEVTPAKLSIATDAGPTDVPLDSVVSVAFAATASPGGARDKPGFRVRFDDGSSLVGASVRAADGSLELTLGASGASGAAAVRRIDLARVSGIEQVNGPVSWLSSRTPSESVYVPFLSSWGRGETFPARMNLSVVGNPIQFRDRTYARGIGVHSYSKIVFPLDGKTYTAFRTRYAIDPRQEDTTKANVTVRVYVDDKVVHEQKDFVADVLSPVVAADVSGAKRLTLEVDYGAAMDSQDRLNWIEPALLKVKPAADASPAATQPATASATPSGGRVITVRLTHPSTQPTTSPATQPAGR